MAEKDFGGTTAVKIASKMTESQPRNAYRFSCNINPIELAKSKSYLRRIWCIVQI